MTPRTPPNGRAFPGDAERELCSTCGRFLRRTHYCDPSDRKLLKRSRDQALAGEAQRGLIAMGLALDLESYWALLSGEDVHRSRLDPDRLAQIRQQSTKR